MTWPSWPRRRPPTPLHNATVEIFEPGDSGFDYDRLVALVSDRISFVPRYRQRVQPVPGRLANPVWVDDEHFDLGYHVRRSALPRPGSLDQLRELVARIVSRPLDRSRPLWEIYFVEGLEDAGSRCCRKSHQVLVDGVHTVDLGQVLLDTSPEPEELEPDDWTPRRPPSPFCAGRRRRQGLGHRARTVVDTAPQPPARCCAAPQRAAHPGRARVVGALTNRPPTPTRRSSGRSPSSAGS